MLLSKISTSRRENVRSSISWFTRENQTAQASKRRQHRGVILQLLAALPLDPFEQLEVAQRITSRAVAAGVSKLETETGRLRQKLGEKDATILSMQHRMLELERTLQDTSFRLSQALDGQEKATNEKNMLITTVRKLKREISKLEMFKKNLLQSLQEDDDSVTQMEDIETASQPTYVDSTALAKVEDRGSSVFPQSDMYGSMLSTTVADPSATLTHDDRGTSISSGMSMIPSGSIGNGSIFRHSAAGTDSRPSQSPTRGSTHPRTSLIPGQVPKVDGKEFFRQARNRLSYQGFSAFLSNIKELNAHRQSREETLAKAEQIFGPNNQDLYYAFDGLITRHTT